MAVGERFGVTLVPVKDMRREFLKRRHERPVWTLVADQRPGGRDRQTVRLLWSADSLPRGPGSLGQGTEVARLLPVLPTPGSRSLSLSDREDRGSALRSRFHRRALRRQAPGGCQSVAGGLALVAQAMAGVVERATLTCPSRVRGRLLAGCHVAGRDKPVPYGTSRP